MRKGDRLPVYECSVCAYRWCRPYSPDRCPKCGYSDKREPPVVVTPGRQRGNLTFAWPPRRRVGNQECPHCQKKFFRVATHINRVHTTFVL